MSLNRGAAYARRHLRSALRKHREELPQMTQRAVGEALDWSPSKIMRIEKGHVRVGRTDLEALMKLYGITDPERRDSLLRLQHVGRTGRSRISDYRDVLSKVFADYLEEEEAASILRNYEPFFIPGPLQTPAYARTILQFFGQFGRDDARESDGGPVVLSAEQEAVLEKRAEVRAIRKELLTDPGGMEGFFIITEWTLGLQVGNETARPEVMVEQLEHLKQLDAEHDNIRIQVIPGSAGLYSQYMRFPFVVLEFDDDETLLLQELQVDEQAVRDDSEEVGRVRDAFKAMESVASPKEAFGAIVDDAIGRLRRS